MENFSWPSIGLYCLFSIFVFYQQLHVKNFRGASEVFGFLLSISAFAGMLAGFAYLIYYGWQVKWWAAIIVFIIGLVSSVPGFFLERAFGKYALSIAAFIGWPLCAYFMFVLVPNGS